MGEPEAAALFAAIRAGDLSAVRAHLDRHPQHVDAREKLDSEPIQPMHVAAAEGHLEIVRLLVERHGTVYSHPMCSYPAVMHASWKGRHDVVDYFLNEIPHLAAGTLGLGVTCNLAGRQGWIEIVRKHLARDPLAVHQRGWIGDTPLHWPAHNGFIEIVRLLLEAGADPNAEENNWIGGTPLHWASERHSEIIRLLVAHGADVNARVTRPGSHHLGGTPLIWNARQDDDAAEAAATLIELGADPDAKDAHGKRAIDYARPRTAAYLATL